MATEKKPKELLKKKPLHKEKSPMSYYDKGEMKKLFEVIKGHPLEVPLTLAAYYGFRRS